MSVKYGLSKSIIFKESGDINETSPFGKRTLNGKTVNHKGVDVVRYVGYNTTATIVTIADGKIKAVKNTVKGVDHKKNLAGNYVDIDHGGGMVSRYFHLKYGSIPASVRVGATIKKGDIIGYMGNTGDSYGAHLHFQLEQNGIPIDGAPYLKGEKSIKKPDANDYINLIVEKVGYDNPEPVVEAFKKVEHKYINDLWRKLWEALK